MGLSCKVFGHKWNGCKCERCDEKRDEQHDWDLCKGRCKRCNATQAEQHDLNGCICSRCGVELHDFNGCTCSRCRQVRDVEHNWKGLKCLSCGKTRTREEALEAEKRIAKDIIHPNDLTLNRNERQWRDENRKRSIESLTMQPVLLDIAINALYPDLQKIAAKKITDKNLLAEYIASKCSLSIETYKINARWELLKKIRDKQILRHIAETAYYDRYRWKACKMSGGHIYDENAVNKCKCTICGFQFHVVKNNICTRCNGTISVAPFVIGPPHGSVTYPDGTTDTFVGYNGILFGENEFI